MDLGSHGVRNDCRENTVVIPEQAHSWAKISSVSHDPEEKLSSTSMPVFDYFCKSRASKLCLGQGVTVAEGHVARANDASLTVTHTPISPIVLFSLFPAGPPTPHPPLQSRGEAVSQPSVAAAKLHGPSCPRTLEVPAPPLLPVLGDAPGMAHTSQEAQSPLTTLLRRRSTQQD